MSKASERSVLSEKFQRWGSWDVMTTSRVKYLLDKGAGLRPGGARADGERQHQRQASLAGLANWGTAVATNAAPSPAVAEACRDFRRRDNSSWSFRLSAAGRLPNNRLPMTERVKGGFMIAKSSWGSVAFAPSATPREPPPVTCATSPETALPPSGDNAYCTGASLVPREVQRSQRHTLAVRAQRHDVEIHAVELDFRIEHGKAGGGEVHGGQLHVVTMQGLFHHGLMQCWGVPSTSVSMAAFRFSGYCHEQRAGAARQVCHVEGGREFVVAPVNPRGPIVEYTSRASSVAAGTDV